MAKNFLPTIPGVARRGSGATLKDGGDSWADAILLFLFAAMWNGFVGIHAYQVLSTQSVTPWLGLLYAPFLIVGFLLLWSAVKAIQVNLKLKPGHLTVRPWPARTGQAESLNFEREAKGHLDFKEVTGRLVFREEAKYRVGTDTRTVTEDVWEFPLELKRLGHSNKAKASWEIQLPPDLPPSFCSSNNKLQWRTDARPPS